LRGGLQPVRREVARLALAMAVAGKVAEPVRRGWVRLALAVLDLDETSVAGESVNAWV